MHRREFVKVAVGSTLLAGTGLAPLLGSEVDPRIFSPRRNRSRIPFGSLVAPEELSRVRALASEYCDVIVVSGGLFWGSLERVRGVRDYRRADSIFSFARSLGKTIRCHTLITHELTPSWLPDRTAPGAASTLLEFHVSDMLGHYRGQVPFWDLLNEVLAPQHHLEHGLRNDFWMRSLGAGYPVRAFQIARAADPKAMYGINEYGLEDDSRTSDTKRAAALALLRHLQGAGVTVDYLGLESHLRASQSFSDAKLGFFLRAVESLGVKVMITELDVDDSDLSADIALRDAKVADAYARYLRVVLDNSSPVMVNTWGLTDATSWQQSEHPRHDGLRQRPLPFDDQLRPKPAWDVLVTLGIAPTLSAPESKAGSV